MDLQEILSRLEKAAAEEKLTPTAAENIRTWLIQPSYAAYVSKISEDIAAEKWKELDDAFWTVISFGTGGRRGKMYPIGCNAINDRTIGESAQGLADYVKRVTESSKSLSCAIAYDTRHRSRDFAELCAEIMAASGFRVYFLDGYRSTPELSFSVRYHQTSCGIMVTASHNPPSDNAVKVYWSGGVQILPPHDKGIIECVMNVSDIQRIPFDEAVAAGQIVFAEGEIDSAFVKAVSAECFPGPRNLKIVYSPLHGVGATAVCPVLAADGFADVELFAPHAQPDGDFPNVPGHVSNPENPAVFDSIITRAQEVNADLVLASDPDCDRIGCAAPLTGKTGVPWKTLTGNQIGVLLTDYVLAAGKQAGRWSTEHYVVKTMVTTEMIRRVADHYAVRTYGNLLVGFKWIGGLIDEQGSKHFAFGAEESHGFLMGTYARDKDASVAAMLLSELAAHLKSQGLTLHQHLNELYRQHGAHLERTISVALPGPEGMDRIRAVMTRFRESPPKEIAGMTVVTLRDYLNQVTIGSDAMQRPLSGPRGNVVFIDLEEEGNFFAVRPSGTEPKVKFYLFAHKPPNASTDPELTQTQLARRLDAMEQSLSALIEV